MTAADLIAAIASADPADLPAILTACASRLAEARSATPELPTQEPADDTSLTIEEAAALLRRSTKWVYRHRARLPFVKKIGARSYVCSKSALLRWRDRQR